MPGYNRVRRIGWLSPFAWPFRAVFDRLCAAGSIRGGRDHPPRIGVGAYCARVGGTIRCDPRFSIAARQHKTGEIHRGGLEPNELVLSQQVDRLGACRRWTKRCGRGDAKRAVRRQMIDATRQVRQRSRRAKPSNGAVVTNRHAVHYFVASSKNLGRLMLAVSLVQFHVPIDRDHSHRRGGGRQRQSIGVERARCEAPWPTATLASR